MNTQQSVLSKAIQLALALSLAQAAQAEVFPDVIDLAELDGSDGFVLQGAFSGEQAGQSVSLVSSAGDINGDGLDDMIIGAPYAPATALNSGRAYVVFGTAGGFPASVRLINPGASGGPGGFRMRGEAEEDQAGRSVSGAGDVNGDGIDDLIIGAIQSEDEPGRAYVVFGSDSGLIDPIQDLSGLDGTTGFELVGENDNDRAGFSVSTAGDINSDGIDDIIIGTPRIFGRRGAAYVVFGSDSGFPSSLELEGINGINGFVLVGEEPYDRSGWSVSAAGDINGDGVDDLMIAASWASTTEAISGRTYVVFGSNSGSANPFPNPMPLSSLDGSNGFVLDGEVFGDYSGWSVSTAGDVNGDDIDDIVIGTLTAGTSYVVFGSSTGFPSPIELSGINGINGFVINGESFNDRSGISLSGAGDINGDGIDDLIIGAPFADAKYGVQDNSGAAYVVFGSDAGLPSPFELSSIDGSNGFIMSDINADSKIGQSVSDAGDVNGDGVDDVIIGAPYADSPYGSGAGLAYVVFGRPSIDLAITKTNGQSFVNTEGSVTYIIDISNPGPVDVTGAVLSDTLPPTLNSATASWSCDIAIGTTCPNASGTGNLNEVVDLLMGASLSYSITAEVIADEGELITNTASINLPGELVDADPTNNSATDTDPTGLFADSFEQEA